MTEIYGYHAHVYFDATSFSKAEELCIKSNELFDVSMGHFIKQPVGPHPCWSCQLSFSPEIFAEIIPWLVLNRKGLCIFIHPLTGDDFTDHAHHAMWMGESKRLNFSIFGKKL